MALQKARAVLPAFAGWRPEFSPSIGSSLAACRWLSVDMTVEIFAENLRPAEALEALMARHGVLRVLVVLPGVLWHRRRVTRLHQPISPHLARDIGLWQARHRITDHRGTRLCRLPVDGDRMVWRG